MTAWSGAQVLVLRKCAAPISTTTSTEPSPSLASNAACAPRGDCGLREECSTWHHRKVDRLAAACRVSDVDNLGHGSMQRLMKLHAGHSAGSSSNIASLAALACTDISLAGRDNGMTVSKAMQQLQAAPQLADLEDWSQWAVACEPALGQLSTFLSQHGMHSPSLH